MIGSRVCRVEPSWWIASRSVLRHRTTELVNQPQVKRSVLTLARTRPPVEDLMVSSRVVAGGRRSVRVET
jgi:hypothetical protein